MIQKIGKGFYILLLSLLVSSCTSETIIPETSTQSEQPLEGFDKAPTPQSVDDIDPLFRIHPPITEEGQSVLLIDISAPLAIFNSLAVTELRVGHFFAQLRKLFSDTKADRFRFTYYDIYNNRIFSMDYRFSDIEKVSSFYDEDFHLFDLIDTFKKIDGETAVDMIGGYCQDKKRSISRFCIIYGSKVSSECGKGFGSNCAVDS